MVFSAVNICMICVVCEYTQCYDSLMNYLLLLISDIYLQGNHSSCQYSKFSTKNQNYLASYISIKDLLTPIYKADY